MRGSRTMTDTRRSNKYFTRSNGTLFACRSSANGTRNARQTARSADVWLRTRRDRPPLVTTHTHTHRRVGLHTRRFVRTSVPPQRPKSAPSNLVENVSSVTAPEIFVSKKFSEYPSSTTTTNPMGSQHPNRPPACRWNLNTFFEIFVWTQLDRHYNYDGRVSAIRPRHNENCV